MAAKIEVKAKMAAVKATETPLRACCGMVALDVGMDSCYTVIFLQSDDKDSKSMNLKKTYDDFNGSRAIKGRHCLDGYKVVAGAAEGGSRSTKASTLCPRP